MCDNSKNLQDDIVNLHCRLRGEMKNSWNRVLPFNELITDRWEKARFLKFGEGTSIYDSSIVIGDVEVGMKTWIGPFTMLDGSGGLKIGSFCSISSGVQIYSHDSFKWSLSGGKVDCERKSTEIGDCSYIGSMSIISKGVKIGNHCVIGANSFVNRDVADYSIAAGSPAKVIGKVVIEDDDIRLEYFK